MNYAIRSIIFRRYSINIFKIIHFCICKFITKSINDLRNSHSIDTKSCVIIFNISLTTFNTIIFERRYYLKINITFINFSISINLFTSPPIEITLLILVFRFNDSINKFKTFLSCNSYIINPIVKNFLNNIIKFALLNCLLTSIKSCFIKTINNFLITISHYFISKNFIASKSYRRVIIKYLIIREHINKFSHISFFNRSKKIYITYLTIHDSFLTNLINIIPKNIFISFRVY